jgi:RNase P subunit RPR2
MENKRLNIPNKKRMRNLSQYRGMSDEDFEDFWNNEHEEEELDEELFEELERRKQERLSILEKDYDFSDMKANDMMQLEALVLAMLQLDDLEKEVYKRRTDIADTNVLVLEKLNNMLSKLRSDISTISTDLQLTKKIRNKSKDISVVQRWNDLAQKAANFYKQKMLYIFCPDCRTLLANVWLLYPEERKNKITLFCDHCNTKHEINLDELYETGNKNLPDIII